MSTQALSTISDHPMESNAPPQLQAGIVKTVERAGTDPSKTSLINVTRNCRIQINRALGNLAGAASAFYLYTKNCEAVLYVYMEDGRIMPFWAAYCIYDNLLNKFNVANKIWSELTPYTKRKIRDAVIVDLMQERFLR